MPTLDQIQAKLRKLQAQADVLIARKAQIAVDQIRDLMLKHGLTTADIEAGAKARRAAKALNGHAGNGKAKAAVSGKPKYRDPKTGATWTGHGRAPGWISGVKDRTQFLVEGASESTSVVKSPVTRAKRGKGQPKGAQPPKYLNPKTGATWSGRGPAPAWLATVKDRSKFLIGGATAAASDASKPKSAAASGAASKKAAAKKAVASRKTAAKKATSATSATRKVAVKKRAVKPAAKKLTATKAATKRSARAASKAPKTAASGKAGAASVAAAPQSSTVQASA
ncbi:UNVERIFIED_ORG: DNA-binding protein H-NS [Burkholderia sp. 1263]